MKCFFDENLGHQLADGLKGFGVETEHLLDKFDPGTPDIEWLPYVAEEGYTLFTKDNMILLRPQERAILKEYKIGAFFLSGKNMGRWDHIRQIIRVWHKILEAARDKPPFAYKVNRHGTALKKISLD
jgi:predicted nuclease of predicted toxin-antitoxin system